MGVGLSGAASLQHSVDLMAYMGSKNKEGEKSPSPATESSANQSFSTFDMDKMDESMKNIEKNLNAARLQKERIDDAFARVRSFGSKMMREKLEDEKGGE